MTSYESATSLGNSSSVEYFLLEPNSNNNNSSNMNASPEILSPIPYRDEVVVHGSGRICFDAGDEEESTLPSLLQHASTTTFQSPSFNRERSSSTFRMLRTELSGLNYLNALAFAVHVFVWWGIAVYGLGGLVSTRWEMTEQYETLVTPINWAAIYLWIPILITEAAFTIAQMLPQFRARPIVQSGTGFFFFYVVLLQIAFTFLYSFGLFALSFVAAVLALLAVLSLMVSQKQHCDTPSRSRWKNVLHYVVFRFPFSMHAAWLILTTVDHFCLLFRKFSPDPGLQLAADMTSMGVMLAVAVYALSQGPDFVIPTVILWAFTGISFRLMNPSDWMIEQYGPTVVEAVLIATYFYMGIVGCCIIPYAVVLVLREFCTISVVELV